VVPLWLLWYLSNASQRNEAIQEICRALPGAVGCKDPSTAL
jgi:hypothetical protein